MIVIISVQQLELATVLQIPSQTCWKQPTKKRSFYTDLNGSPHATVNRDRRGMRTPVRDDIALRPWALMAPRVPLHLIVAIARDVVSTVHAVIDEAAPLRRFDRALAAWPVYCADIYHGTRSLFV